MRAMLLNYDLVVNRLAVVDRLAVVENLFGLEIALVLAVRTGHTGHTALLILSKPPFRMT